VGAWFSVIGDALLRDVAPAAHLDSGGNELAKVDPPRLRALSLPSGAELWSRAYRDTRYYGRQLSPASATAADPEHGPGKD